MGLDDPVARAPSDPGRHQTLVFGSPVVCHADAQIQCPCRRLFDRAYGKAKEFDPSEEKPPVRVDVSKLTLEQRKQFLAMIRKTATVDVSAFVPSQEGPARAAEPAVAGEAQQIGGKAVETGKP